MTELVPGLDSGPSATMYNPLQLMSYPSFDFFRLPKHLSLFFNRVTSLNINCKFPLIVAHFTSVHVSADSANGKGTCDSTKF